MGGSVKRVAKTVKRTAKSVSRGDLGGALSAAGKGTIDVARGLPNVRAIEGLLGTGKAKSLGLDGLSVNSLQAKQDLITDVKTGEELLGKDFQKGSLGRLSEAPSADVADIISRRRAGLEGLSAEENQALRERGSEEIDRGAQTSLRQLRGLQGATGVRGATALASQAGVLQAGQAAKAGVERDLLIQNVEQKRRALGDFETSILGSEAGQEDRQRFNIGQTEKEIAGRQAAGLGFAALGATERGSQRGVSVAIANAKAASGGGKK